MRALRLARLAAEAEALRIRRGVRRMAIRAGLGGGAAVFLLSALAMVHVAGWFALSHYLAPAWAALGLAGADLLIALLFYAAAQGRLPDPVEIEARQTRELALRQLRGQAATTLLLGRSVGLARYLLRRRGG